VIQARAAAAAELRINWGCSNIAMALNMTVSGIVAHQSAMKDGELMKIPLYQV
jgi:hypothetical protein